MAASSSNAVLILLIASLLSGCAALRHGPPLADDQSAIVATDFVQALAQLQGHTPRNTTVQMRGPDDVFTEALATAFRDAGYGLQRVADNATSPMLVSYSAERYGDEPRSSVAYRLRVGSVELAREYEVQADRLFPITALSVVGVPIGSEPLDGSIFDVRPPKTPSNRPQTAIKPDEQALLFQHRTNVLDLGHSNFEAVFEGRSELEKRVFAFDNDSVRLTQLTQVGLGEIADAFNADTDVVSVTGMSHGPSRYVHGNERLAIGRANRVKEALIMAGVPSGQVLEEGCWAGEEQPDRPARGVLVRLLRSEPASTLKDSIAASIL